MKLRWMLGLVAAACVSTAALASPAFVVKLDDWQGNPVNTANDKGKVVVVMIYQKDTKEKARELGTELRYKYFENKNVKLISVPDLHDIGAIATPIAKQNLKSGYWDSIYVLEEKLKAAKKTVPAQSEIGKKVLIAPDWDGDVPKGFGVDKKMNMVHLIVVDKKGQVAGKFTEKDGAAAVEKAVDAALK